MDSRLYLFVCACAIFVCACAIQKFEEHVTNKVAFVEMQIWQPWSEGTALFGMDLRVDPQHPFFITSCSQFSKRSGRTMYDQWGFCCCRINFGVECNVMQTLRALDFVCSISNLRLYAIIRHSLFVICQPGNRSWESMEFDMFLNILLPFASIYCQEVKGGILRMVIKWEWHPKFVYDIVVPLGGSALEKWDNETLPLLHLEIGEDEKEELEQ